MLTNVLPVSFGDVVNLKRILMIGTALQSLPELVPGALFFCLCFSAIRKARRAVNPMTVDGERVFVISDLGIL
jgi:hypothetical protein